jgi:hypothetical protein
VRGLRVRARERVHYGWRLPGAGRRRAGVHRGLVLLGLVPPGRAELLLWEYVLGKSLKIALGPSAPVSVSAPVSAPVSVSASASVSVSVPVSVSVSVPVPVTILPRRPLSVALDLAELSALMLSATPGVTDARIA